ncbi:MAG TPA: glycosyltransferase family 39 protein [Chthoniobacterales bacterium]
MSPEVAAPKSSPLTLVRAILLIIVIWAGVYLPSLGSLELKGEEPRRILPGITMLETGDWVVPYVGGEAYLRKPPMINWLAAISFKLTGVTNEWTARLPSVLGVLVLALATLGSYRFFGLDTAFAAAVFSITNFAMIDKGRLMEIDPLYSVATGVAILLWIRIWILDRSRVTWLCAIGIGFALGFGLLLKGPVHFIFYFAVVLAVCWTSRTWKYLLHPAHCLALVIAAGLAGAWLVPYLQVTGGMGASMASQFTDRLDGSDFSLTGWLLNIPRGVANLLPWVLLAPFGWLPFKPGTPPKIVALIRGLRLAVIGSFVAISLAPGSLPRYTMPVTLPFALWIALLLTWQTLPEWLWKTWRIVTGGGVGEVKILALRSGLIVVLLMILYSLIAVPHLKTRSLWRAASEKIDAVMPPGETLYAIDPGSQPVFFYLHRPFQFVPKSNALPPQARYVLARDKHIAQIQKRRVNFTELTRYTDRGGQDTALIRLEGS